MTGRKSGLFRWSSLSDEGHTLVSAYHDKRPLEDKIKPKFDDKQ